MPRKTKFQTRMFLIMAAVAVFQALFTLVFLQREYLLNITPIQILVPLISALIIAYISSSWLSGIINRELSIIANLFDKSPDQPSHSHHRSSYTETNELLEKANHWLLQKGRTIAALKESEEHLNLALSTGGFGTWDWDLLNDQLHWDVRNHRLYGQKPGSFSGNYRDFLGFLHPDDRDILSNQLTRITEDTEENVHEVEYRVIWPDETIHYLSDRCEVFRSNANQIERMIGITWDITTRKQAELALISSNSI